MTMPIAPVKLLESFWSDALGVEHGRILCGETSVSSTGIYRERSKTNLYIFEHLESGSMIINVPPEMHFEAEKIIKASPAEADRFLSLHFSLEFDDFDLYLPKDSTLQPTPITASIALIQSEWHSIRYRYTDSRITFWPVATTARLRVVGALFYFSF